MNFDFVRYLNILGDWQRDRRETGGGGSSRDRSWLVYIVRWIKLLIKVETERAIVDGATNLKQEVRAAS